MKRIKVLVVDDSALMRKMIPAILAVDPGIEVVGTAVDGSFALKKIAHLKPDVVTLDMHMPGMDGLETLGAIVRQFGTPTVIVSSLARKNAELTFEALEAGAFDFVTKPAEAISVRISEIRKELIEKIRAAAANPFARMKIRKVAPPTKRTPAPLELRPSERLVVIGASTGGPNVLSYLLPQIQKDFPAALAVVQHMPPGFTEMFAARLNSLCEIEVKEARDGDLLIPGRALIAPGDRHMRIRKLPLGSIAVLSDSPPVNGHRPSVDVLFRSAALEYGPNAAAVILTGMGNDGAEGAGEIKRGGGITIAQDEQSCIVFGMPKAAIEKRHVTDVVNLDEMADFLKRLHRKEDFNGTAKG